MHVSVVQHTRDHHQQPSVELTFVECRYLQSCGKNANTIVMGSLPVGLISTVVGDGKTRE